MSRVRNLLFPCIGNSARSFLTDTLHNHLERRTPDEMRLREELRAIRRGEGATGEAVAC